MHVLGRLRAERLVQTAVQRLVRPMVEAAHHVRDREVHVVDDAREVVGRRAVLSHERDPVETVAEQLCRLEVPLAPVALPHRPLLPRGAEPLEVADELLLPAGQVATRVGVVDPEQEPVTQPPVRDRGQGALPRWSEPVGLGANRLLTMRENLHGPLCRTLSKPEPGFERFGSRA